MFSYVCLGGQGSDGRW